MKLTMAIWHLGVQVTLKGSGTVLTASAQHQSEATTAKQQAALDLIHQLQQAVVTMLTASAPDRVIATVTEHSSGNSTSPVMKTLLEGDLENSMPEIGNVVKVQYQLIQENPGPDVENTIKDSDGEFPSQSQAKWMPIGIQFPC